MAEGSIETARLELRRWDERDTELLVRLSAIPAVMRFIGVGTTWLPDQAAEVAARQRAHWTEHGFGWRAMLDRETGDALGFVAMSFTDEETSGVEPGEYEIGWWLDPRAWGEGLAREAALAVRDEAFRTLGAPSVIARIQPGNERSVAVAEAIGLEPDYVATGGEVERIAVYRMTAPGSAR